MWLRFLLISFLNVVAHLFAIVLLFAYVLPVTTPSLALKLIGWALAFIFAILFSYWAFAKKPPTRNDSILLVVCHVAVFVLVYAMYGMVLSDRGAAVIVSPELLVQGALEIAGILLVAYQLKRKTLQAMLGEGRMM